MNIDISKKFKDLLKQLLLGISPFGYLTPEKHGGRTETDQH